MSKSRLFRPLIPFLIFLVTCFSALPDPAQALVTAFRQAIAEGAADHDALAAFYRERQFSPIWTRSEDADRRNALLTALEGAADHGLPVGRYDPDDLRAAFLNADTPYERGQAEILASTMFLQYARDVQSGILDPRSIQRDMARELPRRDQHEQMRAFLVSDPHEFMRSLPPTHPEYLRLMREKLRLERIIGEGGWGATVYAGRLERGNSGQQVIALRDRLVRMGYLERSVVASYDATLEAAVERFQTAHGLEADGVAGSGTIEQINVGPEQRLRQVILGMERQRWLNWEDPERGIRHVLVNIPDFHAYVIDDEEVSFITRVVVGATGSDRRTPEFSDTMEHLIINPSWNVPRSIAVNEYLPAMMANPAAAGHLQLVRGGRVVSREGIDFSQYTARTFPYDLRQPPSRGNALGRVKFMFPNRHNVYLHDTPSRSLFSRESRAFSHGCVRVHRPLDFAYHLLARQEGQPQSYFDNILASGRETQVNLTAQVPVHIVYWTSFVTPDGTANYRRDIYGRDRMLWNAMEAAGVALRSVSG